MSDWIHALPLGWMTILIFGITFLVAAVIHRVIQSLAVGERARALKALSPGLLPPLGIIFGLLVAFLAAQAWGDLDRARIAINQEASAPRAAVVLSDAFPGQAGRLRGLIRQHIQDAQQDEWPAMAHRQATITIIPAALAEAMRTTLALPAQGDGQVDARQAIVAALERALDARRQRITAHDRPFIGQNGVQPTVLLQVQPDAAVENTAR